jgi:hypothetical protein
MEFSDCENSDNLLTTEQKKELRLSTLSAKDARL